MWRCRLPAHEDQLNAGAFPANLLIEPEGIPHKEIQMDGESAFQNVVERMPGYMRRLLE